MGEKGDRKPPDADTSDAPDASHAGDDSVGDLEAMFTDSQAVERRLWRNILVVIACAILAAAIFADFYFLLGLILGGGLALLNYRWLHSSLRAILGTGSTSAPPGTSMKFIVRWLLIATLGWAANRTGYFDAVGILAGLFAPAAAVMIEAAYVTYKTIARRNGEP
jgi:ATP synthase I chain